MRRYLHKKQPQNTFEVINSVNISALRTKSPFYDDKFQRNISISREHYNNDMS